MDTTRTYDIRFFVRGAPYRLFWLIPSDLHLLGVDPPARLFLLGTDQFGRDLLSRILYGSVISLLIGLIVVLVTFPIGMLLGGIAGYYGGRIDNVIMRSVEVLAAFPTFYLLLTLASVLPPTLSSGARAVHDFGGVQPDRVGRAGPGPPRDRTRGSGKWSSCSRPGPPVLRDFSVIVRHVLPSTTSYVIVAASLTIPGVILGESGLSYLGVGVHEPSASWGLLLAQAQSIEALTQFPWLLIPGVMIVLAVLAFNFLGDGVRDALDPRQRST